MKPPETQEKTAARSPRPVTPETHALVAELHAEGFGRNEIARRLDISGASVTKIAQAHVPPLLFDRAQTDMAVRAAQLDMAAERAEIARMLLVVARDSVELMDSPTIVYNFGGREGTYREQLLPSAPAGDRRNHMTTAAIALQRHADLVKIDVGRDLESARSVVGGMRAALGLALEAMAEDANPTETDQLTE